MSVTLSRLEIRPQARPHAAVHVPGSKSVSNRALPVAAAAHGQSRLRGLLFADDTAVMIDALRLLGVRVSRDDQDVLVNGQAGPLSAAGGEVDAGLSGTTFRFLLPLLAAGTGKFRLTGRGSLLRRPIQDQLDALKQLGADARSELGNGCPPVQLEAAGLAGGNVTVSGALSSQYLSGLLLAAPLARTETLIRVEGELQSEPFVRVTLEVMRAFGILVHNDDFREFRV